MTTEQQNQIWDANWQVHKEIDPQSVLYDRYAREVYPSIRRFFDANDKLILEAGCGTGRLCCLLAKDFSQAQVTGMDASENSLEMAEIVRKHIGVSNAKFEKGDLFKMKYQDNYFDVVFNEGVIEHFAIEESPNYVDAVREMVRVTKPGGKIVISVPNWYCYVHTLYKWALKKTGRPYKYGYEKSFKHTELIELFKSRGLGQLELTGFYPAFLFDLGAARGGAWKVLWIFGRFVDFIEWLDFTKDKRFSKRFGAQVVIKGVKTGAKV